MGHIRIACQTYTWEMLGPAWQSRTEDILDWIAESGYAGIEITNTMIGEFADRPEDFREALRGRGLELAAFAYATTGFTDPAQRKADLLGAERAIGFLERFPEPRLALGGAATSGANRSRRTLDAAIEFYNNVGQLAAERGVLVNVHPHSDHGSLLETAEDYQYLIDRLDTGRVTFGPDTGHIVRGGQNLLECLRTHLPVITHIHFKDATADGRWAPLGEGVCDFAAVLELLESAGYDGWVVAEEESEEARRDGLAAIRKNRAFLRLLGY